MSKNSTSSWGESITCANLAHVCAAADATSSVLELVQKVICKLCILLFSLMHKLLQSMRKNGKADFSCFSA